MRPALFLSVFAPADFMILGKAGPANYGSPVWRTRARAGQVDYTLEYSTMGQLTKFVPNGSCRVDSTENPDTLNVAFRDPRGSLFPIAYNNTTTAQTFKVLWRSESFHYTLPVNGTATFRWESDDR